MLGADSVSRCKIAFIKQARIVAFEQYEVASLKDCFDEDVHRVFRVPGDKSTSDAVYDEFCLVANFIVDPLQSVDLVPIGDTDSVAELVIQRLQQRRRKRKSKEELATKGTEGT